MAWCSSLQIARARRDAGIRRTRAQLFPLQRAAHAPMSAESRSRLALYLALGYTLLVVYASLSPFSGWRDPGHGPWHFLLGPWPRYVGVFDLIVNVLAYVPLAALVTASALPSARPWVAGTIGLLAGFALSLSLEGVQAYLPQRISTLVDLAANSLGAGIGAALAARAGSMPRLVRPLARWRQHWFLPGGAIDLGIALVALWLFSQLDPSLPLFGILFFSEGVQAQMAGMVADEVSRVLGPISVMLNFVGLGLLLTLLMRSKRAALAAIALIVCIAALMKLIAATALLRTEAAFLWVSKEVALAILAAASFVAVAALLPRPLVRTLCALALLGAIALALARPGEMQAFLSLRLFRWADLQLMHYTGLAAAVAGTWPYCALLYLLCCGGAIARAYRANANDWPG
jgi:VanZ family protein